jgi:hypothetical protein
VNPLRALLQALTPEVDAQATRAKAIGASLKALRADVQAIRKEVAAVAVRAEAVTRQVAQARWLEIDARTPSTLDALAAVLVEARVAGHVHAAIEGAAGSGATRAGLVIERLWPADVHEALAQAIPDAVFFDGAESDAQTLRVPPRLAPVTSIAVWTFVAKIVHDVIVPAVAARLGVNGPLDVAPGRLVRRPAGSSPAAASIKPWHSVLIEIDLTLPRAAVMPVATYEPPAPATGVRHTYEVWFGPTPA